MSVFKVMQGTFGIDGLEHKWSVFHSETADACWMHIFDTVMDAEGPMAKHTRLDILGSWVEEHNSIEDDYDAVRSNIPYPGAVVQPDVPNYIKALMGRPEKDFHGTEKMRTAPTGQTNGQAFVKLISELPRDFISEILR